MITPTTTNNARTHDPPTNLRTLRIAYVCIPHHAILPLLGYGGTESACEAELEGLTSLMNDGCLEFFAVVPPRNPTNNTYPFPIIEVGQVGMDGGEFARLVGNEILKMDNASKPHLVWCQEEVCPNTLREMGIQTPVLASIHFGDCWSAKDHGPSVLLRFPSHYTARRCRANHPWLSNLGFVEWQAFKDDEFQFSEPQGEYFLWVGGCYWDSTKGLPLFQDLAVQYPQYKFVVFCSGEPPVANRLRQFQESHPNFVFGGELMRGEPHHEAFKKARAFFFWTHMSGETFGRVTIEAFSKGTPVIGSKHAANPELITPEAGLATESMDELKQGLFNRTFDRHRVYARSQYFRARNIVQGLLLKSSKWMTELLDFDVFTNPLCLKREIDLGP